MSLPVKTSDDPGQVAVPLPMTPPPAYHDIGYPGSGTSTALPGPGFIIQQHPQQQQHFQSEPGAPARGTLASRGRLWDNSQARSHIGGHHEHVHVHLHIGNVYRPPGPPGPPESVIQAHHYKCEICSNFSFVRPEDAGTYIKCPFCRMTSTTNPSVTRKRNGSIFLVCAAAALATALALIITSFTLPLASSFPEIPIRLVVCFVLFVVMMVMLVFALVYCRAPVSVLHNSLVPYLPSVEECATLNLYASANR